MWQCQWNTQHRGTGVSYENLKWAFFLFYHQCRCTFDWEIKGVNEETIHKFSFQKKLGDKYEDPDMLPKVNKSDMMGMKKAIKEYLKSLRDIERAPHANTIIKTLVVQTYNILLCCVTPD